ncbi:MAG: regulatory protein [Candidatus Azotimanducaceae bacterium]|jgi:regulatory protein
MPISSNDVRRAAMDLLARREHGATELQDKVLRRFNKVLRAQKVARAEEMPGAESFFLNESFLSESFTNESLPNECLWKHSLSELVELEVAKLTESGLQSDTRLAESFIRAKANRGQGPMKVKMELRQKGLSDDIIQQAMMESEVDWQTLAIEVSAKKFSRDFTPSDPKQRAKRQRFLQQRGFSFEQISAVERE